MSKKFIKVLGVLFSILTFIPSYKAYAEVNKYYNVSRICGQNRFETSFNIGRAFSSKDVKNVIIADGNSFPDSLVGSALAKKLNAPILLINNKSFMDNWSAEEYIFEHLPKDGTIYILGGEEAISSKYIEDLQQKGYTNFKRLGGINRFDTNAIIVDEMNVATGTPVIIANGLDFPDALSISSIAANKGYPILMSKSDSIPDETLKKLSSINPSKIYFIGGTAVLSDTIKKQVQNTLQNITDDNIIRISGTDRYETSINVCKYFNLDSKNIVMASGQDFPDALSGSVLAAKLNAPIILNDGKNIDNQKDYIDSTNYTNVTILGGEGAISSSVEGKFNGIKLKVGGNFPINSDNKIIDFTNRDVNGDGNSENIILTQRSDNKATLYIQNPTNGQIMTNKVLEDTAYSGYGTIILADVNGDKIDDIMSLIENGGSDASQKCDIETYKNNVLSLLGQGKYTDNPSGNKDDILRVSPFENNSDMLSFSLNGWDNLNISSKTFNQNYSIDLTGDKDMQQAKSGKKTVDAYIGHGPRFWVNDIDGDGIYEVNVYGDISGSCHADVLGEFLTYYKYSNSSWVPVKQNIESDYLIKK